MDRPNLFWALAWLRLHEHEDRRTQALALCTEIADRQIEVHLQSRSQGPGLELPGWSCTTCHAFHGETRGQKGELVQGVITSSVEVNGYVVWTRKEPRTHCRSCGAARPL
jgi:hypothetical protein